MLVFENRQIFYLINNISNEITCKNINICEDKIYNFIIYLKFEEGGEKNEKNERDKKGEVEYIYNVIFYYLLIMLYY